MSRIKVLLIEKNEEKRKLLAQQLAPLSLDMRTLPSLSDISPGLITQDGIFLLMARLPLLNSQTLDALRRLKKKYPDVSVIVLSDSHLSKHSISLLKHNVIDHVASPDHLGNIYSAIRNEYLKRDLLRKNALYAQNLKRLRLAHSRHIRKALELEEIYNSTLENLMTALDLRDVETFGHSQTVAKYSEVLAQLLGIQDEDKLNNIRTGALLHDVGKIAIPDVILKKPNPLSSSEWDKIKLHPALGFGLIKEMKLVPEVGNIILYHHEKFNGQGYPKGLKKEEIPLEARIFTLADTLDAITSHRPYRKERDFKAAKREIEANRGTQFDPKAVEAFCSVKLERWEKIRYETTRLLPSFEYFSDLMKVV